MSDRQTLRDVIAGQARRLEKRLFLEHGDTQYSYAETDDRSDRVATGLTRLGLRAGDRVALLLSNRPEYVFSLFGIPKIGAVSVPLEPGWPAQEILGALRALDVAAVIADDSFRDLRRLLPGVRHWIFPGEGNLGDDAFSGGSVLGFWPDVEPDSAAVIAYTGGRSGPRKYAVLTHRNLISSSLQLQQPFRIDETDRFLCALPLSLITAQIVLLLAPWMAGAASVLEEPYGSATLSLVQRARITVLAGTPRVYDLIAAPLFSGDCDLSQLRLAICHSGRVGEHIRAEFEDRYDALLVECYGLVEATALCCANPYTGVRKPGAIGLPLPGQRCRIVDADDRELPAGKPGEIVVRGPNIMRGYFRDAEGTAKAVRDGWLHTGDIGYTDSDGYYYLTTPGAGIPG